MDLPEPGNPGHTANLATIPLLEAQGFHGNDVSLAISLFEYDLVWRTLPPPEEMDPEYRSDKEDTLFVYRLGGRSGPPRFDRQAMDSTADLRKEFDWISEEDWQSFFSCLDTTREEWEQRDFGRRIADLFECHGYENIFGSSYWEGFAVQDPDDDET